MQEVSRVGAQGVTSKSKLLAREMPDLHTGGLRADSGAARSRKGVRAGQRVDRRGSYASVGPGWKIQEVSRVGAQGVPSKSKLLARGANVQQQRVRGDIHCSQRSRTSIPCPSPRTRPRRPAGAPPSRRRPSAPAQKREKGRMVNVATATRVLVRLEGHRGHRDQKSSSHSAPSSAATRRAASSSRPACRARRRAAQPRPPPRRSRRT